MEKQLQADIKSIVKTVLKKNQYEQGTHFEYSDDIKIYTNEDVNYIVLSVHLKGKEEIEVTVSLPSTYRTKETIEIQFDLEKYTFEQVCQDVAKAKRIMSRAVSRPLTMVSEKREKELKRQMKQLKEQLKNIKEGKKE